jgi:hypothetical protein
MEFRGHTIIPNILYTPATTQAEEESVYVMFPGNPGLAEFYVETMRSISKHSNGSVHVYTIAHAGQGLVTNNTTMPGPSTLDESPLIGRPSGMSLPTSTVATPIDDLSLPPLPRFDGHRLSGVPLLGDAPVPWLSTPCPADKPFSLREQGGHLILEVIRALERTYVLLHYGSDGLKRYDELNMLKVSDVETEGSELGVHLDTSVFQSKVTLEEKVTQFLFADDELKRWLPLIQDCPAPGSPAPSARPQAPAAHDEDRSMNAGQGQVEGFDVSAATYWIVQTQLLMATVMRIGETPNGVGFTPITRFMPAINVCIQLICALPGFVKRVAAMFSANPFQFPVVHATIRLLINEVTAKNIMNLAKEEMFQIRSLDTRLLLRIADKSIFYMVDGDGWAPMHYTNYLQRLAASWTNRGWKAHRVYVDKHGMRHAYMFGKSDEMGMEALKLMSK